MTFEKLTIMVRARELDDGFDSSCASYSGALISSIVITLSSQGYCYYHCYYFSCETVSSPGCLHHPLRDTVRVESPMSGAWKGTCRVFRVVYL